MNKIKFLSVILFSIFLFGCDYAILWEDSPYEIHWINSVENRTLAYSVGEGASIGRVNKLVIAVGSNEKYIVAKQRDLKSNEIYYYFIEREKDKPRYNASDITKGPFLEVEFSKEKKRLNLPEFSKEFRDIDQT